MNKIIPLIIILLILNSCVSKKKFVEMDYQMEALNSELAIATKTINNLQSSIYSYKADLSRFEKYDDAKQEQLNNFLSNTPINGQKIIVEEAEEYEFLNGKLPKSFYQRKFYNGLSATTYDLFNLPGKIVKKTESNSYEILTPVPLIKTGVILENEFIEEGLLFKDYLMKGMSANGSYVIGSFEAKNDKVIEVTLTDVIKAFPKPGDLDIERLKRYQNNIKNKPDNGKYYFIQSATLTIGSGRTFNSSKFKKNINAVYLTASGDVYRTNEQIKKERIITVELILLKDMLL